MPVQTNNCVMLAVHFGTITKHRRSQSYGGVATTIISRPLQTLWKSKQVKTVLPCFPSSQWPPRGAHWCIDHSPNSTKKKRVESPWLQVSGSTATRQQYPVHTKNTGKNSLKMSFKNVPHLIVFPGENLILFVTKLSEDGLRKTTCYLSAIKYDTREYPASKNFGI